jgi:hypothetical protein
VSAVSDTTRNIGTVLGVAVTGSVAASVFAARMAAAHLPARSLSTVATAAGHGASGTSAGSLMHTASAAFVAGADRGALVAATITLLAALAALVALRSR